MTKRQLKELTLSLSTWGSIIYVFIVALVAVGSGNYIGLILKGLIGLVIGWIIIIPIIVKKYL